MSYAALMYKFLYIIIIFLENSRQQVENIGLKLKIEEVNMFNFNINCD